MDKLRGTHRISNLTRTKLILRENGTNAVTPLSRADHLQPVATKAPAPTPDPLTVAEQEAALPGELPTLEPAATPAPTAASPAE